MPEPICYLIHELDSFLLSLNIWQLHVSHEVSSAVWEQSIYADERLTALLRDVNNMLVFHIAHVLLTLILGP